ncbi:hypothetical protein V6N13_042914 [Hibiscus sabdariffa]
MPVVNHEAVSLRPRDCSSDLGLLSLKSSRERERQHRERTSTICGVLRNLWSELGREKERKGKETVDGGLGVPNQQPERL